MGGLTTNGMIFPSGLVTLASYSKKKASPADRGFIQNRVGTLQD